MILADAQVTTSEVKSWKGLHLLHFAGSSCSQKVRILLGEKNLPWVSHHGLEFHSKAALAQATASSFWRHSKLLLISAIDSNRVPGLWLNL